MNLRDAMRRVSTRRVSTRASSLLVHRVSTRAPLIFNLSYL